MKSILPALLLGLVLSVAPVAQAADPLPSWNDGAARTAVVAFVEAVTDPQGDAYVPGARRIAVFDNDGTLWSEKPVYFQLLFAFDRVRTLAQDHPEWRNQEPFQAVLEGDLEAVAASGKAGLAKILATTHAGMTSAEFEEIVRDWLASARHPKTDRPYTEMVFQPMLELLDYLRANGFKTFIVSGGGIEFMRVFTEEVYGIPPEQVIGSSIETQYEVTVEGPVIRRLPELDFVDDKAGKPVGIHKFIGRRPIAAFGNSDGDFQMLEWTTAGEGRRLGVLIHHDDDEREWAYDRESAVGRLDRGLAEAEERGWTVVRMKRDFGRVFVSDGAGRD